MTKDRLLPCISYVAEKNCKRGKEGTFYKACQKCPFYEPVRGAKPARVDRREKKIDRLKQEEMK